MTDGGSIRRWVPLSFGLPRSDYFFIELRNHIQRGQAKGWCVQFADWLVGNPHRSAFHERTGGSLNGPCEYDGPCTARFIYEGEKMTEPSNAWSCYISEFRNKALDSITEDLLDAYNKGDLAAGLCAIGMQSSDVAKTLSRAAIQCLVGAINARCEEYDMHERAEAFAKAISSDEILRNTCADTPSFVKAVEKAIQERMRKVVLDELNDAIRSNYDE